MRILKAPALTTGEPPALGASRTTLSDEEPDKYAKALEAPRLIFDLYPKPRPQGATKKELRALPAAITMSVIGTFEGFAEDLLAAAPYKQGHGWAHIAQNADLTNPSVRDLQERIEHTTGVGARPAATWATPLPKQSSLTGWHEPKTGWSELLTGADGWLQVRHCLAHGLTTGLGPEIWPGPSTKKAAKSHSTLPAAGDVLARTRTPGKVALHFWSAVGCARIFSVGAAVIAEAVAQHFGEQLNTDLLHRFDDV